MTFIDNFMEHVTRDTERVSKQSARQLQLWLSTIAPVDSELALKITQELNVLAKTLHWKTSIDDHLHIEIIE